jgi:hypothetical protein
MCKIKEITVPKFCLSVESLPSGKKKFSLDINANIMIPRDKNSDKCIAEISVKYETEEGDNILDVIIRGSVTDVDCNLGEEEKCNLIKEQILPTLYLKLRVFIELMLKTANIDLPNIPPVEKVNL